MVGVPGESPEERLKRFAASPPPTFNADYAKLQLELERERPRTPSDRLTVLVALITSAVGALVAAFNVLTYWGDRTARTEQQIFEDQVKVAAIYFEKIGPLHGEEWCNQSRPFSGTTLAIAKMKMADIANSPETGATGVKAVATALVQEIGQRSAPEGCDAILPTAPTGTGKAGDRDVLEEALGRTSKYALQQGSATAPTSTAVAAGVHYEVFIQYLVSDADAKKRAETLKAAMPRQDGFVAPGIEGVRQIPDQDQIRIYLASDAPAAEQLRQKLPLPNAQIVNLESVYKNLPHGRMEIWLGQKQSP